MRNVLILGATSAIAAEVAKLYAARGDRLLLVGRNPEKLSALSALLPGSDSIVADFNQLERTGALIDLSVGRIGRLDDVLIAHGYLGDQQRSEHDFSEAELILRSNFLSVVALLVPLANQLERQGQGKLGVITSVAGERGRPRNYTYGAAKGALNVYMQGLRTRLVPIGVSVTTLKVGPVDSPMTVDHPKHLLFAKPPRVAAAIVAAISAGTPEAFVPWFWRPIMTGVRATPEAVFQKLPFLSGR